MKGESPQKRYLELKRRAKETTDGDEAGIPKIFIGMASCGIAAGAIDTKKAFERAIADRGIAARIYTTGCIGHCYAEPVVIIDHPLSGFPPIFYHEVNDGKAVMLTKMFLEQGDPRFEHVLGAFAENELIPSVNEFPRFSLETRVLMERCGRIDPENIYDYIAAGGYSGLALALGQTSEDVIETIEKSGLRGRGGAGFPTWRKWAMLKERSPVEGYLVCNADEGDPGAYMDRTLIESNPHQLIEGMLIAAYATGLKKGLIYVRSEYPIAVRTLEKAVAQAEDAGLVGKEILGSSFDFEIELFVGSGAFVCGEETALIRSVEGKRGTPRHRPPYPVTSGLWGKPTVINNVKTLAMVPVILEKGAEWFRSIGTEKSPGTALFSVVGDILHPGLVEVPMGTTLKTLIMDVCGGIPGKKSFKAVQIGGPSGGCLPESFLDTPIDFDALSQAGAMMGSGGIVVMDEGTCMVDVARYFMDFIQKESCGKCTFCRIGSFQILEMLKRITGGKGRPEDLSMLVRISESMKAGSLCGLGKTAANPVLTSIAYFKEEYEAHINEKRCPAGSCRELTAFYIDPDKCAKGCDICGGCCPVDAVFSAKHRKKAIDQELCVKCGECQTACPPDYNAVIRISPAHLVPMVERPDTKEAAR